MSVVHKSAQWRQLDVGLEEVAAFMGCILTVNTPFGHVGVDVRDNGRNLAVMGESTGYLGKANQRC